ncbi:unnamed protein product [Orchesella dallaii]|uniref:Ubiquitin-like domain-containing protein n=1 Tax=Orchesella dallaii TaxID=48710 RepID=A0ABP1R3P1_9HEXA
MRLTITTTTDFECDLEVREDLPLEDFKAVCEVEFGIPASEILIIFEGRLLTDDNQKSLKEYNIKDGDLVVLQHIHQPNQNPSPGFQGFDFNVPEPFPFSPEDDLNDIQEPNVSTFSLLSLESGDEEVDTEILSLLLWDVLLNDPEKLAYAKQNYPDIAKAFVSWDFAKFSEVIAKTERN